MTSSTSIALDSKRSIHNQRGLTLIEILVAIAITLAFLVGVVLAFIELMNSSDRAQARLNATANARHALGTISKEISRALGTGPNAYFVATSGDFTVGDRSNNDSDTEVDEEFANGHDEDGDWTSAGDRHAQIGPFVERSRFQGIPDLGDGGVDEDNRFAASTLIFNADPSSGMPSPGIRRIRYLLGSFDGESNVLLQEVTTDFGGPSELATTSPIAFGVLSFEALFWDQRDVHDDPTTDNGWKRLWNSDDRVTSPPLLPASVYLSATVYAGSPRELTQLQPNELRETVKLSTIANVQEVLFSPEYAAIRDEHTTGPVTP